MTQDSGSTLARQWAMLRALPRAPRRTTVAELARRLADGGMEVSRRTVERDLQALSASFPLVLDDRAKPYGWSWSRDANFEFMPGLTQAQALTLLLAKAHLRTLLPLAMQEELLPVFDAAEAALAGSGWKQWHRRTAIVPAALALRAPAIPADVLDVVHTAIARQRCIAADYRAKAGAQTRPMTIHPLGLLVRGPVQYLVCTLFDYADIRQLAVHRLQAPRLLAEPCKPIAAFDLQQYAAEASRYEAKGVIRLVVRIDGPAAEHLRDTPLSDDQRWEPIDGDRVEVRATVENDAPLRWWLLAFGSQLEVVEPADLRAAIVEELALAGQLYEGCDARAHAGGNGSLDT